MTTLRMLAQQLTEPHFISHNGRIGKVPPLLKELRDAIGGSTHEGGGNGTKQRILVNAPALDLLRKITEETKTAYTDRYGQTTPQSIDGIINTIANNQHPDDWEKWFINQYQAHINRIEALLRPKKLRRLDGIQCPSCEQTTYGPDRETCLYADCWIDNENLLPIQEWSAHCKGCEAHWTGHHEMKWLIAALA